MILCGDSVMWLALAVFVLLVAVCVVCVIGYFCCFGRWCDRRVKPDHRSWL